MGRGRSGAGKGKGGGSFHQFPEKASGTHTYEGDGRDVEKFFSENSNFDELISQMNDDEKLAFSYWCRGYFMSGQQYQDWDKMSAEDRKFTQIYDKFLDQATLTEGITVVRRSDTQLVLGAGKKRATLEELQAAEGSMVTSKGSMSTGAASQGLTIGDSSKPIEYRISIPGGSTGAGMWIGDDRINGWGSRQREFMTNRDSVYRVGKTTYDKSRGIYITDLVYVGREAHDYGSSGRSKASKSGRRSRK